MRTDSRPPSRDGRRRVRGVALAVLWGSACTLVGGAESAPRTFVPGLDEICTAHGVPHRWTRPTTPDLTAGEGIAKGAP